MIYIHANGIVLDNMSVSLLVLNTNSTVSYMNDFRHSVYHYDMCQNNKSNDSSRSHMSSTLRA